MSKAKMIARRIAGMLLVPVMFLVPVEPSVSASKRSDRWFMLLIGWPIIILAAMSAALMMAAIASLGVNQCACASFEYRLNCIAVDAQACDAIVFTTAGILTILLTLTAGWLVWRHRKKLPSIEPSVELVP